MRSHLLIALVFVATSSINTRAIGQNVYKCGSTYSQSPCPGGMTIDARDIRTPEEKAQRDALTAQTRDKANQMEKERLTQEKNNLAANTPNLPTPATQALAQPLLPQDKASAPRTAKKPKLTHPKKQPEGFVAVVPGTAKPHKSKAAPKKPEKTEPTTGKPN